jgi:hypothetical protein
MVRRALLLAWILLLVLSGLSVCGCTTSRLIVEDGATAGAEGAILRLIAGAMSTVDAVVGFLPSGPLADAIQLAAERGVHVRVVLADSTETAGLAARGIPAASVPGATYRALVIDGTVVLLGSLDFLLQQVPSSSYDLLLIDCSGDDNPDSIAAQYESMIESLWEQGTTAGPPAPSNEEVILYEVDVGSQCVTLLNVSAAPIDLAGWSISDLEGVYTFPPPTQLVAGIPWTVCIDTYNPTRDPAGMHLDEHDEVYLADREGNIVAEWVW